VTALRCFTISTGSMVMTPILRDRFSGSGLDVRTQQRGIVYGVPRGLTLDHYSFADPCAFDSAATVRQGSSPRMGGFGL
jgi:hypothetical protein